MNCMLHKEVAARKAWHMEQTHSQWLECSLKANMVDAEA